MAVIELQTWGNASNQVETWLKVVLVLYPIVGPMPCAVNENQRYFGSFQLSIGKLFWLDEPTSFTKVSKSNSINVNIMNLEKSFIHCVVNLLKKINNLAQVWGKAIDVSPESKMKSLVINTKSDATKRTTKLKKELYQNNLA